MVWDHMDWNVETIKGRVIFVSKKRMDKSSPMKLYINMMLYHMDNEELIAEELSLIKDFKILYTW